MNRQQRRAQQRGSAPTFRPEGQFITMPIGELSALFGLTDDEVTEEWAAERLDGLQGRPVADGWADVSIPYDSIVAWLSRKDLPPATREKTKAWFAQLEAWLRDFKSRCRFEEDESGEVILVLPDGRKIHGLYFRRVRRQ